MSLSPKPARFSQAEQINIVMSGHINGAGRLFGGSLVEWIDVVAAVAARRHRGCDVTTAAIDNLQFKSPAYAGDTVILNARLTYAGRTSMEVRVDTYVESLQGARRPVSYTHLDVYKRQVERKIPLAFWHLPRLPGNTCEIMKKN